MESKEDNVAPGGRNVNVSCLFRFSCLDKELPNYVFPIADDDWT